MFHPTSVWLSILALLLTVHHAAAEPQCSPPVVALAAGIKININGQHGSAAGELAAVQHLQAIEAATPVNHTEFLLGKGALLADIAGGMKIRKFNQGNAPKGNAANPGLAKYAKAQQAEQKLSESLTGVPAHDKKVLATLVSDIHKGTALNEQNYKNAIKGCSLGFTPS